MKKLFLFLLVLPLAFMACSSDDDKEPGEEDLDKMTIEEYMSKDRKFKWAGDWNDPDHPKYKPEYATKKYNPLVGVWHKENTIINGVSIFTEDYHYELYDYDPDTKYLKFRNRIPMEAMNDKVYRNLYGSGVYGFSSSGRLLYINLLASNAPDGSIIKKDKWSTWKRLDESDYILPDK